MEIGEKEKHERIPRLLDLCVGICVIIKERPKAVYVSRGGSILGLEFEIFLRHQVSGRKLESGTQHKDTDLRVL